MGLTKRIIKPAINNFNVNDVMAQLKKKNTVDKKKSPRKPIDSRVQEYNTLHTAVEYKGGNQGLVLSHKNISS